MPAGDWFAVTNGQALRFFFERLRELTNAADTPTPELLYNASMLAHFATTSTASTSTFPSTPTSLTAVFDLFVLDRSRHADPELAEAAGAQCLLLTGFFQDQLRRRHNLEWYAALGAGFYEAAAQYAADRARARMMQTMAQKFGLWRARQHQLAIDLRDEPRLLPRVVAPESAGGL